MKLDWGEFCFGYLFTIKVGLLSDQPNILLHPLTYQQLIPLIITCTCFAEYTYQDLDLLSLLQNHRLAGATYPKDKVYALIELFTEVESQSNGLILTCSLPTAKLYTEVSNKTSRKA